MIDITTAFGPISETERTRATIPDAVDGKVPIIPVPEDAPPCDYQHPKYGAPTQRWAYHTLTSDVVGYVARFDYEENGKPQKTYLPLTYCQNGKERFWAAKGFPEPRPLYRLPSFAKRPNATVLVCEGEKAALAAAQLFPDLLCTTTPGGAQSPGKADLSPLKGHKVVTWPDNDEAGADFAQTLATLATLAGARSVSIVSVPENFPPKWDLADRLPSGVTVETLRQMIESAGSANSDGQTRPQPLLRKIAPPEPYPMEALGPILGDAAEGIHERVQAPIELCANSVLAAATLAAQGRADVMLPTGQTRPLTCFIITVAASGERKTSCDNEALAPIKKHESRLREEYEHLVSEWRDSRDTWESERRAILGEKKKFTREDKHTKLKALGAEPKLPLNPTMTMAEPTFEGLVKLLVDGQPSVAICTSEGGSFVGGHGLTDEAKLRTASGLSTFWDGGVIKRVRAGEPVTTLAGRRLAIHLMMQPDVAAQLLTDPVLQDQGLVSRLLISAPQSLAGTRFWKEPNEASNAALNRYSERILSILEMPWSLREDTRNELDLPHLLLDDEARQLWILFADHIESQIRPGGDLEPVKAFANKLAEHATRLAGVLTIIEDPHATHVDTVAMKNGIRLAQYYADEALRLYAASKVRVELAIAQKTLNWLHTGWAEELVSLPDVYQYGPNEIRDKQAAEGAIGLLEDHDWLVKQPTGETIKGQYRKTVWRVVRDDARI